MKENGITLILTLYNPTIKQIEYWKKVKEELSRINKEIYFLNDNPSLKYNDENEYFVNNKVNKGKFRTVYDFVKTGRIKTKHFKVCDPDDKIDLDSFLENYNNPVEGVTYIMNKKKMKPDGSFTLEEINSLATCSTILDTISIETDEFLRGDMFVKNWIEDQILGVISYINGAKIEKVDYYWYEYFEGFGMTSEIKGSDAEEILQSLKTFWDLISISNSEIKTSFPGDLNYLIGLIENSENISLKKKNFYIKELSNFKSKKISMK